MSESLSELFTLSHIFLEESPGIPVVLLGLQGFLEESRWNENPANVPLNGSSRSLPVHEDLVGFPGIPGNPRDSSSPGFPGLSLLINYNKIQQPRIEPIASAST